MGRPSPRKDCDTRKAEQVSWLAAWLTLCAFPSRRWRDSGPCRFQRRSHVRGRQGFSLPPRGRGGGGGRRARGGGPEKEWGLSRPGGFPSSVSERCRKDGYFFFSSFFSA